MSKIVALAAAFTVLGSWSASASGATTPLQGTLDLVEAVKGAKNADSLKKVRTYFDYDQLVEVPIQPHKDKLTQTQLGRYTAIFRELLENAPLIASLEGGDMEYKIGKPVEAEDSVKVALSAYNAKTDMDTDVTFIWRKHETQWRVVDVTLDGVSLVKGYQNQFGRILHKEGAEGLISRLEKQLSKVRNPS